VAEVGTHFQLMNLGGIYKSLVFNQTGGQIDEESENDNKLGILFYK